MGLADLTLYRLAKNWPSPMAKLTQKLAAEPGTDAYAMAYAQHQFNIKVRKGMLVEPFDKDVLEIGCGHGGISCFIASVGARSVTGIDLNTKHLGYAVRFSQQMAEKFTPQRPLSVRFLEMSADRLAFANETFDLILADNVFEHFTDYQAVLTETYRTLRPGGQLLIPVFSSIYSKWGLHLKHGLKLPWANLFFSEKTIIAAMQRLARDNPQLLELYPGLSGAPERVRDLRRYKDLNDITYASFRRDAAALGFQIEWFRPVPTRVGHLLYRIPGVRRSFAMDIFSKGAAALLRKPAGLEKHAP